MVFTLFLAQNAAVNFVFTVQTPAGFGHFYWDLNALKTVIFCEYQVLFSLYVPLFLLSMFLTGALLVLIVKIVGSTLVRRLEFYWSGRLFFVQTFWESLHPNWRPALRKTLDPSCFSLFSLFSSYTAFFVYLLPFIDIWVLMDPNVSPLQVINTHSKEKCPACIR